MDIRSKYRIEHVDRTCVVQWVTKRHYAGKMPCVVFSYGLIEQSSNTVMGVCTFGFPPAPEFLKGKCVFETLRIDTLELNRLVTIVRDRNVLSFFVSQCLKQLPKPMCIVSFADPMQGHHGYIYQATNWIYTGTTVKHGKDKIFSMGDRTYHGKALSHDFLVKNLPDYNQLVTLEKNWLNHGGTIKNCEPKHRYIYLLATKYRWFEMRSDMKYESLPYPKGDNRYYDDTKPIIVQGGLFD